MVIRDTYSILLTLFMDLRRNWENICGLISAFLLVVLNTGLKYSSSICINFSYSSIKLQVLRAVLSSMVAISQVCPLSTWNVSNLNWNVWKYKPFSVLQKLSIKKRECKRSQYFFYIDYMVKENILDILNQIKYTVKINLSFFLCFTFWKSGY